MKLHFPTITPGRRRSGAAFTLIEIALCIAIVAFALVAIIGILPTGMGVQRENREDTMINSDGPLFMEAIRNATTNLALLTNNIEWIETRYETATTTNFVGRQYATNQTGHYLLGTMCTPKYLDVGGQRYTNHTLVKMRAGSGPLASEATNVLDFRFNYLLSVEVIPQYWLNGGTALEAVSQTNLYDLKLIFQWPILRDSINASTVGLGRRVLRSQVAGRLVQEDQVNSMGVVTNSLWFFTPDIFSAY